MAEKSALTGFESFDFLLKNLGPRVGNRVLQNGVSAGARAGAKEIRRATPAHLDKQSPGSQKYGPARKNIKVKRLRRHKSGERGARIDTGNAFWLVFYHFGTRYQRARPFFDRAFLRARETMLKVMGESIGKGIEKEALKMKGNK
jgi:HK97 gp10 family phage protein